MWTNKYPTNGYYRERSTMQTVCPCSGHSNHTLPFYNGTQPCWPLAAPGLYTNCAQQQAALYLSAVQKFQQQQAILLQQTSLAYSMAVGQLAAQNAMQYFGAFNAIPQVPTCSNYSESQASLQNITGIDQTASTLSFQGDIQIPLMQQPTEQHKFNQNESLTLRTKKRAVKVLQDPPCRDSTTGVSAEADYSISQQQPSLPPAAAPQMASAENEEEQCEVSQEENESVVATAKECTNKTSQQSDSSYSEVEQQQRDKPQKVQKRRKDSCIQLEIPQRDRYNNSKNVLRLYQRAVYQFMLHHSDECTEILGHPLEKLVRGRRQIMGNLQSIRELRSMWVHESKAPKKDQLRNRLVRIMTYRFLRDEAVAYFTNRPCRIPNILQYRQPLMEMLTKPQEFVGLKMA